ncbi:hypothetical protein EDB89DRAFT_1325220 [Lactarius sanguifluus]|nr:hypothetical protein EDB89DRAFT_1325220 [Lactarius sanguifluus]
MSSHSHTSKTTLHRRLLSRPSDTISPSGVTSIQTDDVTYKVLRSGRIARRGWKQVGKPRGRGKIRRLRDVIKIEMLPDDVLLRVFDFCSMEGECAPEWWHGLAHVCRKWRQIILLSPRRLDLQLLCTCRKPVRKNLCCWPAIPIAIDEHSFDPAGQDNLFAALEKTDRVLSVSLKLTKSELEKVTLAMQRPFPALTRLRLELIPSDSTAPVILPGFLGASGYTSCLREINLNGISFLALPTYPGFSCQPVTLSTSTWAGYRISFHRRGWSVV